MPMRCEFKIGFHILNDDSPPQLHRARAGCASVMDTSEMLQHILLKSTLRDDLQSLCIWVVYLDISEIRVFESDRVIQNLFKEWLELADGQQMRAEVMETGHGRQFGGQFLLYMLALGSIFHDAKPEWFRTS
jgi:hypothetical protein